MPTRVRAHRISTSHAVRYWVDETCWAELPDADPRVESRLLGADGWATRARLHRGLSQDDQRCLDGLLDLFTDHGLAVAHPCRQPLASLQVAVIGSGQLARHLTQGLLRSGIPRLDCHDPSPPDPHVWPGSRHSTGGAALARWLRPRNGQRVRSIDEVAELADQGTQLVLVAPDRAEADRMVLDQLVRHDLPHLVLGCHGEVGRIGPLVLTGRSPCMTCHDLARTQGDPQWPQVLARLMGLPAQPDASVASAVAARAVLEVGWLLRSLDNAARLEGHVEMIDLQHPQSRSVDFTHHPDCGCCWRP